jgi:hypothetical protein
MNSQQAEFKLGVGDAGMILAGIYPDNPNPPD